MNYDVREIVSRFKVGLLSITWLLKNYYPFSTYLRRHFEIVSLRPLKIAIWHRGAKYFKGKLDNGRFVFLKTDGIYQLLRIEIKASEILSKFTESEYYFPRVIFYDLSGRFPFAAFEWISGNSLASALNKNKTREWFEKVAQDLVTVLSLLSTAKVIHRDFTAENVLIVSGGHGQPAGVRLVDFAFAVIQGHAESDNLVPVHELICLGTGYKPYSLVWDDAYACKILMERMSQVSGSRFVQADNFLDKQIGITVYRCTDKRKTAHAVCDR